MSYTELAVVVVIFVLFGVLAYSVLLQDRKRFKKFKAYAQNAVSTDLSTIADKHPDAVAVLLDQLNTVAKIHDVTLFDYRIYAGTEYIANNHRAGSYVVATLTWEHSEPDVPKAAKVAVSIADPTDYVTEVTTGILSGMC